MYRVTHQIGYKVGLNWIWMFPQLVGCYSSGRRVEYPESKRPNLVSDLIDHAVVCVPKLTKAAAL